MENALDGIWRERPDLVRGYYDLIPVYQRLCDEVKYILEKKIKNLGIEIGHVSARAKSLMSFCEKIDRKVYERPLEQITDFSGVRIVYLYASDRKKLEDLIEAEFEVLEKVDKVSDQETDKFGYGALHYIVCLKELHAGARYDDLRTMRCEIQVRTILQDAWAIVAHHLSYKHEDDIPTELKRKLHALSGLFETADDQFERINYARVEYQKRVKTSISTDTKVSLEADVNLDNLLAYMSWKFPDREQAPTEIAASLLQELHSFGYKRLHSIDELVNKALPAVLAFEEKYPPGDALAQRKKKGRYLNVGMIRISLAFADQAYRDARDFKMLSTVDKRFDEFQYLVQ